MEKLEDYMIVPPHLNAEVYRTDTSGNGIVSYLDYIKIHPDGTTLVGSSEITGRYWDGGASVFNKVSDGKTIDGFEHRSINLNSGTADGCFVLTSDKALICEDSGAVSIWSKTEENPWQEWMEVKSVAEHDNGALAVDCLEPGCKYVTVGADGNAKVWDIEEMICVRNYGAHTSPCHTVATRPDDSGTFATASFDEHIILWDSTKFAPAIILAKNDSGVRSLQWIDEFRLLYGDDAGILKLLDLRMADSDVKLAEFPAGIHKITLNAEGNKLGVCCDNTIVSVCKLENTECRVVYHDRHMHNNLVRGMAWDVEKQNVLHSVGWECVVQSHTIE